jgi:hypothetical protein
LKQGQRFAISMIKEKFFLEVLQINLAKKFKADAQGYSRGITLLNALAPARHNIPASFLIFATRITEVIDWLRRT